MKRKIFVILFVVFGVGLLFCTGNRKVSWNGDEWVLKSKQTELEQIVSFGSKLECEEGVYFVYDNLSKSKFLVDKNGYKFSEKQFMHVGNFSGGKTVVSGYLEDQYETDRIYDVVTDSVSEPIDNMWIYCGFFNGLGAFSVKTSEGLLRSVLVDSDLNNVTGIEFDEFIERDFSNGIWHFVKDGKDYFINKSGNLIR